MPRIVVFDETGGPDVLRIVDHAPGDRGRGEVRFKVEAIGVNRMDQIIRNGSSPRPVPLPGARLGFEATGTVDALGPDVEQFEVGDPDDGLIHHSDAGSQYTSIAFAETLVLERIAASIGSFGDAYNNALAETTIDDVEYATMEWVDW